MLHKQEGNIQGTAVLGNFNPGFSKFRKAFIYRSFKVAKACFIGYSF